MSTLTDEVYTVPAIAARLGIPRQHVASWAVVWHGWTGTGNRHKLDVVDMYVARAWQVLGGAYNGDVGRYGRRPPVRYLIAETAIRDRPKQWLLLAAGFAMTFDTAEAGAAAWLQCGWPAATLIDLWSVPQETTDA